MSTSKDYTLVYDFSTLGEFEAPHPRYNLKDLPVVACSLAYEQPAEVERVVTGTWKRNFVAFFSGAASDLQAYIFTDDPNEAKLIVLAFRGSNGAVDWLYNASLLQTEIGESEEAVHSGFWTALSFVNEETTVYKPGNEQETETGPAFDTIQKTLLGLKGQHPNAKILVTGHSLGGALALIFTFKLSIQSKAVTDSASYKLVTFGQPKVGNAEFLTNINGLTLNYTRVVNDTDIVPKLPPSLPPSLGYYHVGTLLHYFQDGTEKVERQPRGIVQQYFADHAIEAYVRRTKESLDEGKAEWLWKATSIEEMIYKIIDFELKMLKELLPTKHVDDDSHCAATTQL